jgi:hypothetical protein
MRYSRTGPRSAVRSLLACLLLLLSSTIALSESSVVFLIRPERAGGTDRRIASLHEKWIAWPPAVGGGENRLLSIGTGVDWRIDPHSLAFRRDDATGQWEGVRFEVLRESGYFTARSLWLRSLHGPRSRAATSPSGGVSRNAMLLAFEDPWLPLSPQPFDDLVSEGETLLFYEAHDWDEVSHLHRRLGARIMVLEYPPPVEGLPSRFWLYGDGWPEGIPLGRSAVPGLLSAAEIVPVLLDPARVRWVGSEHLPAGSPFDWALLVRRSGPAFLIMLVLVVIYIFGCAVYCVTYEQQGRLAALLLRPVLLLPAWAIVTGGVARVIGPEFWVPAMLLAALVLAFMLAAVGLLGRWIWVGAHPLLPIALVGATVLMAFDPVWSFFSNAFWGAAYRVSPHALGALIAYLVGVAAWSKGAGTLGVWIGRAVPAGALLGAVAGWDLWWRDAWPVLAAVVLAGAARSEGVPKGWSLLPLFVAVPEPVMRIWHHGLAIAPRNLHAAYAPPLAHNLGLYYDAASSPAFLLFAFLACVGLGAVGPFFWRQFRWTISLDHRLAPMLTAAAAGAVSALLWPEMVVGAVFLAVGAVAAVLFDAVRKL